jgi:hypothetical protein
MLAVTTGTGAAITPAADALRTWLLEQDVAGLRPLEVRFDMAPGPCR